jgi:hypothetical protein
MLGSKGVEAVMADRSDYEFGAVSVRWDTLRAKAAKESPVTGKAPTGPQAQPPLERLLYDRDESDPDRAAVELVQRGRLILDVSAADLEAAEATFGAFHPTTWHFRTTLMEARRSWERLCAELGTKTLGAALKHPPLMTLSLGKPASGVRAAVLTLISGRTYQLQQVTGTELAPVQWRLTRLNPPLENGPYFVCRLSDGSTQCDCADWTYQIAEASPSGRSQCKHLAALAALGWI